MTTATGTRPAAKLKLAAALVALVTIMYYANTLLPYITGSRSIVPDKEKPHRVDFIVSWIPDRPVYIRWRAGSDADELNIRHSQWYRNHYVDDGAVLELDVAAQPQSGSRFVRCIMKVDYEIVRGPTEQQNGCSLRYVVPPGKP